MQKYITEKYTRKNKKTARLPVIVISSLLGFLGCSIFLFSNTVQKAAAQFQDQNTIQNQTALTLTPATGFVIAPVGEVVEHKITIKNDSSKTIEVQPKIVDFVSDGKTGTPLLQGNTKFNYFTTKTQNELYKPITLYANQSYNFVLEIEAPQDAITQEYPMTVLFESTGNTAQNSTSPTNSTGSSVTHIIGSNMIVMVSKGTIPSSRITNGLINSMKVIDSLQTLKFSILLENDSQSAALASGSAIITNVFNEVVSTQPIQPDVVLSKSSRLARHVLETNEEPSKTEFMYDEPFLLGPYTVALEVIQEDGSFKIISQKTVLALPLSLLAAITLISVGSWIWKTRASKMR